MRMVTFSHGIKRIDIAEEALGQTIELRKGSLSTLNDNVAYIGWGRKKSGEKAANAAGKQESSVIYLEDGFLGYWGHPSGLHTRLSLSIDRSGIYYDARQSSDLESMLVEESTLNSKELNRARALIESIRKYQLTKYNHHASLSLPEPIVSKFNQAKQVCLVVDQTAGDQSIYCGMAQDSSFSYMLDAAIAENPDALIVVKTHPDVIAGNKKSAIGYSTNQKRVLWISDDVHPHALIEAVDKVYVVTSQVGFEALLLEKEVICFGVPFFAGWGLTDDRAVLPARRNRKVAIEKLVYDSLIRYAVYVHPDTGKRCEIEQIIEWIRQQRRSTKVKHSIVLAVGFSLWKKAWLSAYTNDFASTLKFVTEKDLTRDDSETPLLVWGARNADRIRAQFPTRLLFTMEDGFVRSAGLGTDLKRPSSLIVDQTGIYYDSRSSSELEDQLNSLQLTAKQRKKGREVIDNLITSGTTKYNVGSGLDSVLDEWLEDQRVAGRMVILVPGQVEGDASIEFGSPRWKTNLELLEQTRKDFPEACILYKPHPDIIAKNRKNTMSFEQEGRYADRIITDANIALLYPCVDRVCTLTSLSGFEALIRGVPVSVYGLPFYAGWGLTDDRLKTGRRVATRDVEELAYISLVSYPRYVNWKTWKFCSLDIVMDQIRRDPASNSGSTFLQRFITKIGCVVESRRFT